MFELSAPHENTQQLTSFLFPFGAISSIFTSYRCHYYRCIRDRSLITGVVLSLFGCTGIGIVTSRIGCELNRDKQVEALHASHLSLFVYGHVYEVGCEP